MDYMRLNLCKKRDSAYLISGTDMDKIYLILNFLSVVLYEKKQVMIIRIAIVDDERKERENLEQAVRTCIGDMAFDELTIDCFSSGKELMEIFEPGQYDIVFLDIMMSGMSGIDTGRKVREADRRVRIVFVTTSNDFAAESYEVRADYYLLKPYTKEQIIKMLTVLDLSELKESRAIVLPDGTRMFLGDIIYTEYYNHVIHITRMDGGETRVRMVQSDLEQLLCSNPDFYSCIRGVIVNFAEVESINKDTVVMKNGKTFSLSRSKRHEAEEAFADYLFQSIRSKPLA